MIPYAAPIDSRFSSAAFSAITGLRNAASRSTNAANRTTAMMIGSRLETVFWKSIVAAVVPVIRRRVRSLERLRQNVITEPGLERFRRVIGRTRGRNDVADEQGAVGARLERGDRG